ncbi:hypothetical protein GALLN_00315 [Gallionellaceae bacterium]|nr:hypothetical protein GALLN_00315 [Gallionellaceae bacterium]
MMKQFLRRILLSLVVISAAGCSNAGMPTLGGMFGDEDGNAIHVAESKKASPNAPSMKYAASIRINRYADVRSIGNPRKIGTGAEFVSGMRGKDLVLDQDVATVVTNAMKTSLDDAGFQVREAQDGTALFDLSGTVKELIYDVKVRDEVSIAIETSLKEIKTGKVVWSGIVVEKNDRFAGVSGNNKKDVANYLRKELGVVTDKTTKAISDSLMAASPELFNLTPGTRPIPGVSVLVAPSAVHAPIAPAPTLPVQQAAPMPAASAVVLPQTQEPRATATSGLFLINTKPTRAKVYLDGVYYGLSPLRLEMEPGVHALSVKMEGYKTVDEKVSVRKGDSTEMDLSLER